LSSAVIAPPVPPVLRVPAGSREKHFQGLAALTENSRIPGKEALPELMLANGQTPVKTDSWTF
jgi:hypothetical protein